MPSTASVDAVPGLVGFTVVCSFRNAATPAAAMLMPVIATTIAIRSLLGSEKENWGSDFAMITIVMRAMMAIIAGGIFSCMFLGLFESLSLIAPVEALQQIRDVFKACGRIEVT